VRFLSSIILLSIHHRARTDIIIFDNNAFYDIMLGMHEEIDFVNLS